MKNILLLLLLLPSSLVRSQTLQSGYYNNGLALCYDIKNKKYICYLESYRGAKFEYSCIICFVMNNNGLLYYDNLTKNEEFEQTSENSGTYDITSQSTFYLAFNKPIPDCRSASPIEFNKNTNFKLVTPKAWVGLMFVKTSKCSLYSKKDIKSKKKGYIVKNEVIKILKEEDDWLYIEYENFMMEKHRPLYAWVRKDNCYRI